MRYTRQILLVLAATIVMSLSGWANNCKWKNVGNDWFDSGNWDTCGGGIPGSSDTATFDAGSTAANVTSNTPITIAALVISGYSGTLTFGPLSGVGNPKYVIGTLTMTSGTLL